MELRSSNSTPLAVIGNPLIRGQRTIKIQKITHFLIPKIDTLRRAHSSIVLMCLIFNENTWGDAYEYYQYAHEILLVFIKYYENAKRFSALISCFSLFLLERERARKRQKQYKTAKICFNDASKVYLSAFRFNFLTWIGQKWSYCLGNRTNFGK